MSAGSSHASQSSPDKVSWAAYPFIALIYLYRYTLSPVMGNQCRFAPTCSRYAEEALRKHGALKGAWMALKRIGRCHPWREGGYDPVP
ncbi:membrane protein insertion efficiency factor YidD [bacterium]|nr:membrane protein insertion efficiency factor YidD [bacterium]